MSRAFLRACTAPALVLALGAGADAAVGFHLNFSLESWSFDGSTPNYNLFPEIQSWYGFSDPNHVDNAIVVKSPNDQFEGSLTGSGSFSQFSPADVLAEANAGPWSISVTDGLTGDISEYQFEILIDSGAEDLDYWRCPTITNHSAGDVLSQNPTFEWTIDPAADPSAEYDQIVTQFYGPAYYYDFHTPDVTSWSPGPLDPGNGYNFVVRYRNYIEVPDFVSLTGPDPLNDADPLDEFTWSYSFGNLAGIQNQTVIPAPGTIALAGAAGLVAIRRRR